MVDDWAVGEDALDWFSDCSWANGESELKRGKTKEKYFYMLSYPLVIFLSHGSFILFS